MGGKGTTPRMPDPINPGEAQGEYLFGPGFRNFQGVTDPRLVGRLIESEARFRPEFSALELADIATFARGTEDDRVNPRYEEVRREDAGFKSILAKLKAVRGDSQSSEFQDSLGAGERYYLYNQGLLGEEEDGRPKKFSILDIERQVQRTEGQLKDTPKTLEGQQGLFDLLETSSRRAGKLQAEQLGEQRAADVAALQEFAPQVVSAYRAADRPSTNIAEAVQRRAGISTGPGGKGGRGQIQEPDSLDALRERGESLVEADLQPRSDAETALFNRGAMDIYSGRESATAGERALQAQGLADLSSAREGASLAERAIQSRGLRDLNARLRAASGAERALARRGLADINAQLLGAGAAERQLQQMGTSLGSLSPTQQEALISGRGTEFIQSTGELTPLELRRAQQSARQASVARGRELGQGALADEIANRLAEETNKRERELALGSQLLGQAQGLRSERLGQSADILQDVEGLAAQRRLEQLQRQQAGVSTLGLTDDQIARRLQQQLDRQMFGTQALGSTDDMEARRIQQQLQRQQFGAGTVGQAEALNAQRRLEELQRQQFGTSTLGLTENLAARKRGEELQNIQLGAGLIGQEEALQSARLGQAFGMNRALAGDAGNIILGRPSAAIGLGQQTLGQAQAGAAGPVGPQLFDPNVGINMALQNQQNQFGLLGAQAQANAALGAGRSQMAGQIAAAAICWVAREVYGIENPKWIQFRNWMLNDSPSWFRKLYIKYGERFAKFISNKPILKNIIRMWMNTKIK